MSIPNKIALWARDLWQLFFPPVCPVCGSRMESGSRIVCTRCRMDAPLTYYWRDMANPVAEKFYAQENFIYASSFLFFLSDSGYRNLIHRFKYHGQWLLAQQMGYWFGSEIRSGGLYSDIDMIVPVPLHWRKRLRRGYNQSEYIALGMSRAMNVKSNFGCLKRIRHNKSQAQSKLHERWQNVSGIFVVRHADRLAGAHILLVDDVLTTGATICSCAEAIRRAVPDCRLSVATLAVAKSHLNIAR